MYSVVLDLPNDAKNIFLGALLIGKGQAWIDDLAFEVVDRIVAVTSKSSSKETEADDPAYAKIPKATIKRPVNLGFEEGRHTCMHCPICVALEDVGERFSITQYCSRPRLIQRTPSRMSIVNWSSRSY